MGEGVRKPDGDRGSHRQNRTPLGDPGVRPAKLQDQCGQESSVRGGTRPARIIDAPVKMVDVDQKGCSVSRYLPGPRSLASTRPPGCHLTGTQYLGIISFMDCSMCTEPIPEPRLLVVPHTLTCSPECSHQRIRWRSRERAKLQRQRRKAANAANREKA